MRQLRGLLVDDDEETLRVIEETLDLEFGTVGCKVGWTPCTGAGEARREIRNGDLFDFAIIDFFLRSNEQDGLAVVEELHHRDERTFILVVTSQYEREPAFVDEAIRAGATHAIVRSELFNNAHEWKFGMLAKRIREHLASEGLISVGKVTYDRGDPGILSVLEGLGEDFTDAGESGRGVRIVQNLAMKCLAAHHLGEADLHLSYLVPGRSGAHICRIDLSVQGEPTQSFVLKFGLDKAALHKEQAANRQAGRILSDQTLISVLCDVQSESSGYCAIAARTAETAVPLRRWLLERPDPAQAGDVAAILFGEQLRNLFRPEMHEDRPYSAWLGSSALYRLRVHDALDRYREAVRDPLAGNLDDVDERWKLIADFVDTGALPVERPERLNGNVVFVGSFGDLHSSNVLVQTGLQARPVLVDASMYGRAHWGMDSARLLVDLFLRVRGAGVPAMLWSDLGESLSAARTLCPRCDGGAPAPDASDQEAAVDAFIGRAVANLPEFLQFDTLRLIEGQWHWQWHVALAKELLRQAPHSDLTPARTALALAAAAEHLGIATTLLDNLVY